MTDPEGWLDTETMAALSAAPPQKLAPPEAAGFSLVLLVKGPDPARMIEALRRVPRVANGVRTADEHAECPFVVASGLTEADALLGQFELICSDCVSVFIQDEIVRNADSQYLRDLYGRLLRSPEFERVRVTIGSLPPGEAASRFLAQFLGTTRHEASFGVAASRKKARIMRHWGRKVGATVRIEP